MCSLSIIRAVTKQKHGCMDGDDVNDDERNLNERSNMNKDSYNDNDDNKQARRNHIKKPSQR